MVSGKEQVFKNDEFGKYIYITEFPTKNKKLNKYLNDNKQILISRQIRKFDEHKGKKCIYISNITRQEQIAFIGNVEYFGGGLLCIIPKSNTELNLDKIIIYLNSDKFKHNFNYSGRFKIGHRQLSKSYINRTYIE